MPEKPVNEHITLYKKKLSLQQRLEQADQDLQNVINDIEKLGLDETQKKVINELLASAEYKEDFFKEKPTTAIIENKEEVVRSTNALYEELIEQSKAFTHLIEKKHPAQKEYLSTLREIRRANRDIEKQESKKSEQNQEKSNKQIKKSVNIGRIRQLGTFLAQTILFAAGLYLLLVMKNTLTGTFLTVFACVAMGSSTFSFKFSDKFEISSNENSVKS